MHRILLFEPTIDASGVDILRRRAQVEILPHSDEETVANRLSKGEISAVIVRTEMLTRKIFEASRGLKVVSTNGIGYDMIDVKAAGEAGVIVVNAPQCNIRATAEHAVLLMLACLRNLAMTDRAVRKGQWEVRNKLRPGEIGKRTLLVVGFGRIGRDVAEICRNGFGMNVLACDSWVSASDMEAVGVRKVNLEEGMRAADVITLHVPAVESTYHLIDSAVLAEAQPSAILVNCSRGSVVDEGALAAALQEGRLAGAGLDVFEKEPPSVDDAIFGAPNTILTPHLGGDTKEAHACLAREVPMELLRILDGNPPRFQVNRPYMCSGE